MRRVTIDGTRAEYDPATDVLFVALGDHDPTLIDREDAAGDGVYVQYAWPGGEPAFVEVMGFSRRYGSLPATIPVPSAGFELAIPHGTPAFA